MLKRLLLIIFFVFLMATNLVAENLKEQFESKYQAWIKYCSGPEVSFSSDTKTRTNCKEFKDLVALGPKVLPFIIEKIKNDPEAYWLSFAVSEITKVKIEGKWNKKENRFYYPDFPDINKNEKPIIYWWDNYRKKTSQKFEQFYSEWKILLKQGKKKEANEKYQKIQDLGIDAIPNIVEKIDKDDVDLIPALENLTDGEISQKDIKVLSTNKAKSKHCADWWNKNKDKWTIKE